MVEFLNPLHLFRQSKKRTYYIPSAVFLGLSFRDEYASVAISDKVYYTAHTYGVYPRDETFKDKLVDVVQSLKKDRGYDLEGIIVANNNSVVPRCSVEKVIPELQECLERTSAQPMLQAFLHVFITLHTERDKESMVRKNEREGKDEEREEFERKALQHDFNIKMKRYEESKRRKKKRVGKDKEREESKRKVLLHDFNINMNRYEESKGRKKERVGKDKEREESKRKKWSKIIE
ncbi:hypothetical protein QYF36_000730 [Acer negundo]|nr:hypothetical protein QYF36_000730 [Acer negundo]